MGASPLSPVEGLLVVEAVPCVVSLPYPHEFSCSPIAMACELGSSLPRGPTHAVCVRAQYVSEAAAAIAESSVKTKDVGAVVQVGALPCSVCSHHCGYTTACQTVQ